jgi:hypothetical protein
VLIDAETRQRIDVLPDRSANTLEQCQRSLKSDPVRVFED